MSSILDLLVEWRVPLLIGLAVVAVLALGALIWVIRRSRQTEGEESSETTAEGAGPLARVARAADLEASFVSALRALKTVSPGGLAAYQQPWYLALGPVGSGTSSALDDVPLGRRIRPETDPVGSRIVDWHFYDEGVVLDVHGDLVQRRDLESDETTWRRLLSLLRRHRPDRPIDGVILTLPAPELLEWRRRPADELREVGAGLFRKLQEAQTVLGVRFPVYVLLTRGNELPGFSSFVDAVPRRFRQDAFGWSTPYALETAFRREWIDQAFASIGDTIRSRTMEVLGARGFTPESDALFRFPEVADWLVPATTEVLAEIFEDSAYHEAFFLRGVYLTGRAEIDPAEEEPSDAQEAATEPTSRSVFLARLFNRKIFPERGLARTFRQGLLSRNRQVRSLQIAVVALLLVGIPALWAGHASMSDRSEQLGILLDSVGSTLGGMTGGQADALSQLEGESRVNRLLRQMASVDGGPVRSPVLPTSWFSDLDEDVAESLTRAFPTVILPTLRRGLIEWPDTLTDPEWAATLGGRIRPDPVNGATVATERFQEYEVLVGYLSEIGQFAEAARRYNRLGQPGVDRTADFGRLYEWYYEETLPNEVSTRGDVLFTEVLAGAGANPVSAEDWPGFEPAAALVAAGLVGRFYRRLTGAIRSLETGLDGTADANFSPADLRELYRDVREVEAVLNSADSTWLMPDGPMVGALQQRLDSIPATPLVDRSVVRNVFSREFDVQRRAAIATIESELDLLARVIPSIAVDGQGGLRRELGPALDRIATSLGELVDRDFMQPPPSRGSRRPQVGVPSWDFTRLEETLGWFNEYQGYREGALLDVPAGLRGRIDLVAARALSERVRTSLANALVFEPVDPQLAFDGIEAELARRLTDFDQAGRRLGGMLQIDAELGSTLAGDAVAETILLEASDLLADLDLLLSESRLWIPAAGDFSAWEGEQPVWAAAYGATEGDGLEEYFAAQVSRLEELSAYGRSILAYLDLPPVRRILDREGAVLSPQTLELERKWRGIVTAVADHGEGVAGNGIDRLNGYLRESLDFEDVSGCASIAPPESSARDWFAGRRTRLAEQLERRCTVLVRRALLEGWDRLQLFHARDLAGRFPFASPERASIAPPAEPAAVRAFIELWDEVVAPLDGRAPELVARLLGDEIDPVLFRRLDGAADFLRGVLVGGEETPAGLDVRPLFRTPRDGEQGGDQVVDWLLQVDGRTASYRAREDGRLLRWRVGAPVRASLVWASQSSRRPAGSGERPDLEVVGAAATFRYEGPWALLRLLAANPRSGVEAASGARVTPSVAEFTVITRSRSATEESVDPQMDLARLMLTLELRGPEGVFRSTIPIFPSRIPPR